MRTAPVAAIAVGIALATALAVLRLGDDEAPLAEGSGVRAAVSLDPRYHLFGDTVRAQVDVAFDRERIDPRTVTLRSLFEPYEQLRPETFERTDSGRVTRLRWVFTLACLEDTCMPDGPDSVLTFPQAAVLADGRPVAELAWPPLAVSSRLQQPSGSAAPRGWSSGAADIPPPTFRVTPAVAVPLLAGAAGLLVGLGALLLAVALRRTPRPSAPLPPLEHALALLDAARRDDRIHEERKALDLLSVELSREGEGDLAEAVTELAWARERPDADATDRVADRVAELIRTRNGSHA